MKRERILLVAKLILFSLLAILVGDTIKRWLTAEKIKDIWESFWLPIVRTIAAGVILLIIEYWPGLFANTASLEGTKDGLTPEQRSDVWRPPRVVKPDPLGHISLDPGDLREAIERTFDMDKCFVRQRELAQLRSLVSRGKCVNVIGDYGAGKTTLIQSLGPSLDEENYQVGYMDLARTGFYTHSQFWKQVAAAFGISAPVDADFLEVNKLLQDSGKTSVLILDNLDTWVQRPVRYAKPLGTLPGLTLGDEILVVSAESGSGHYDHSGKLSSSRGSPFFSTFVRFHIDEISETQARNLLSDAHVTKRSEVNFCLKSVAKRVPLDLLVLAYLLREYHGPHRKATKVVGRSYSMYRTRLAGFRLRQIPPP